MSESGEGFILASMLEGNSQLIVKKNANESHTFHTGHTFEVQGDFVVSINTAVDRVNNAWAISAIESMHLESTGLVIVMKT